MNAPPALPLAPAPRARRVTLSTHRCADCGSAFEGSETAEFCTLKCKDSFWNRQSKRGRVAMPLAIAWRAGSRVKGDEVSPFAYREFCALADRWAREDRDAGRDPFQVARRKMESGWRAVDLD